MMGVVKLSNALFCAGIFQIGAFTLKSGAESPFYLDLRLLMSHPALLKEIAGLMAAQCQPLSFDRVAGIPFGGLALATALSLENNKPAVLIRPSSKNHGTQKAVEGTFARGERLLVIDDLISHGTSKIEFIQAARAHGFEITDILVLINRDQGGVESLKKIGVTTHAIMHIHEMLKALLGRNRLTAQQFAEITEYLSR